ncbi:MAG: hypothetical protein AMXMBFR64_34400 [Myxococcales bacterium]
MTRTLAALLLASFAAPAGASLTRPLTVEQLAADSDAVVRGRVVEQAVEVESDSGRVRTLSTVEVDACLRGDDAPGARVVVSQLGGTAGAVTVVASGTAPLAVGQEVLLFLRGTGAQRRVPVGMARGVWFVHRGDDGLVRLSPERPAPGARELPRWDAIVPRVEGARRR